MRRMLVCAGLLIAAATTMVLPAGAGAAISDQSVAYQQDPAHDGALSSVPLTPPLQKQWTDSFGNTLSYPLVVNGTVYIDVGPTDATGFSASTTLYALNEATGTTEWSRSLGSAIYGWSDIAYDAGRVFGINDGGLLTAVDAVTGAVDWSVQVPGQGPFEAPPMAVNGIAYLSAGESGVFAFDEQSGTQLWTQGVDDGDDSSPAYDGTNVYVVYPCQYYAFNALSGTPAWHDNGSCTGGRQHAHRRRRSRVRRRPSGHSADPEQCDRGDPGPTRNHAAPCDRRWHRLRAHGQHLRARGLERRPGGGVRRRARRDHMDLRR